MFFFAKQFCLPKPRRGWFSTVTGLGVAIQWLAFVSSLWCILLKALSPTTETFTTPFTIHPLSSLSSLFTTPPTPPRKAAKAIKPPRREEEVESTPKPSSVALFVCFAVAHTLARHVPDVLETQRKPAVSDGRGIEESLNILYIPSDEESLRKPAVASGRGIEESSDVTTTLIRDSISNEGNVNTNERAKLSTVEDTNVTNTDDVKKSVALAVLYALAAAEKTDDEQLRELARRLQWHHTRHVTQEATTQISTDLGNVEQTGAQTGATTETLENIDNEHEERGDIAEFEKSIKDDKDVEVKEDVNDECVTAEVASDANREIKSEDAELKEDVEEMKDIEEKPEMINNQDTENEKTDECAAADASDTECETETEEPEVDAAKSKDVQVAAKPKEDVVQDAKEDDDDGEWFTICKGKAVKTSARAVPPPAPVPLLATSEAVETATSSSTVTASEENLAQVSTPESRNTVTKTCSKDKERHTVCHAEKLPAVPSKPQVKSSQRVSNIVPASNPNWLENKAERYRKEMEAWNAFKEAERAVERAKAEVEERKAREVEEAKTASIAKFDTTMSRLDGLLKVAREAKQKWEQQKKENVKTIKEIGSAQNRIGEMIDMEKVRSMFDPEVLKTSSFSSVVGPSVVRQETAIPEPVIVPSSSVKPTDKSSHDNVNTLQQNAADRPGPPRVLPSNAVKHGAARTSKTDIKTTIADSSSALQQNAADRPGPSRVPQSARTSKTVEKAAPSVENSSALQQNSADRAGPPRVLPSAGHGEARTSKTIEKTASVDKSSAAKQNTADPAGPPRVLPSNWGVRYGTVRKSKTIERRLRRRRNELRRQNAEAGLSSNSGGDDGGGGGESPERDDT